MAFDAEEECYSPADYARFANLEARRAAGRRILESNLIPGLPVDADAPETRTPVIRLADLLSKANEQIMTVRSEFFDVISDDWKNLFPGLPAFPGRYEQDRLILYVKSAPLLFEVRRRLRTIKKKLLEINSAPRNLAISIEIRS